MTSRSWKYLIRFEADDGNIYFAEIVEPSLTENASGTKVKGYRTFDYFLGDKGGTEVHIEKVGVACARYFNVKDMVLIVHNSCYHLHRSKTTRSSASASTIVAISTKQRY